MHDVYLTPGQVAQRAGVSYQTVLSHIKQGKLSAMQLGPNYAILESDALRYAATGGEEISQATVDRLEWQLAAVKKQLARQQGA